MKEEYLKMRKSGEFNFQWFYKYYIENFDRAKPTESTPNPTPLPFEQFLQVFGMVFQMNSKSILTPLDKEFELRYIEDKNGNFIRFM